MSPRSQTRSASRRRVRVAPRSQSGAGRVDWDGVGRRLLAVVLIGVCIYYVNPIMNFVDSWRDAQAAEERVVELRAEKRELERRAEALSGSSAAEAAARRLGLVAEGERSFSIKGLER